MKLVQVTDDPDPRPTVGSTGELEVSKKPNIVCVVPSIRPDSIQEFRKAWAPLFKKHEVTIITVWDGRRRTPDMPVEPVAEIESDGKILHVVWPCTHEWDGRDLVCRHTDAVRNFGFVEAAKLNPDYVLTLDDDVHPPAGSDPIQEHLDVLQRKVPISWMNTALEDYDQRPDPDGPRVRIVGQNPRGDKRSPTYLRGFPYAIRDEAPVKVSHGVWVNVPDFDGRTQLELGKCMTCANPERGPRPMLCSTCKETKYDGSRLPYSLPYFRGPVPRGCYLPFCGMNVMVHRDALPYLYFAPMGPDTGVQGLNRFADIWMGLLLKRACDSNDWAIYTGASTVIHTRASDPFKNVEQERLGVEWNEWAWWIGGSARWSAEKALEAINNPNYQRFADYWKSYLDKAARFRNLIRNLQGAS